MFDDRNRKKKEESASEILAKQIPYDSEAERGVLGSVLLMPQILDEIASLKPDDFHDDNHRLLFETLKEMHDDGKKIDVTLLSTALRTAGHYDKMGGAVFLAELVGSVANAAHAVFYAEIVTEKAVYRRLIESGTEILRDAYSMEGSAKECCAQAEQRIFAIMDGRSGNSISTMSDVLHRSMDRMEARMRDEYVDGGAETGLTDFDKDTGGLHNSELIILAARPSMGKAQPLDAPVLTPGGFVPMGQLNIGDRLASIDGQPSEVTGVFPQGEREVYRVTFADGRSTECCAEHLWRVDCRHWDGPRVIDTAALTELLNKQRYQNRVWIETFSGEFGQDDDLPIDPWLLGLLLAEGNFGGGTPRFSTAQPDILRQVALTAAGCEVSAAGNYDYRLRQIGGKHVAGIQGVRANPLTAALQELDLHHCKSHQKFVPDSYRNASRESRIRLLAGLLDGDGWVESFGSVRFATSSRQLADDVVYLARSLGGTASWTERQPTYTHLGESRKGRTSFVCNLQHPEALNWFTLDAKRARLAGGRQRQRRLNIVSIEPSRITQTQCISVSHPSRLYVTDDFIVTHNTALAMNIAENVAIEQNLPVLFVSLEMSSIELADRMLCSLARVNGRKLRDGSVTSDDRDRLVKKANEIAQAPMFIDDSPSRTVSEIAAAARRIKRREEALGLIVIDYLQLIDPDNSRDPRQEQVAKIARRLKGLARELEVPLLCLSQLNRQAEEGKDHRPKLSHLRESGAIEQDADVVMFVHREEYYHRGEDKAQYAGQAEIIIAKQRNGPVGDVPLTWEAEYTRFSNRAADYHSEFADHQEFTSGGF